MNLLNEVELFVICKDYSFLAAKIHKILPRRELQTRKYVK